MRIRLASRGRIGRRLAAQRIISPIPSETGVHLIAGPRCKCLFGVILAAITLGAAHAGDIRDRRPIPHAYCSESPTPLTGITNAVQVSSSGGSDVILVRRQNGSIAVPGPEVPAPGDVGFTSASEGRMHGLAVTADGTVVSWGDDHFDQLGHSFGTLSRPNEFEPGVFRVPQLTAVIAVVAGEKHSLALRKDGSVWAWGSNNANQLGNAPSEAAAPNSQVANQTASLEERGLTSPAPRQIEGLKSVVAIAAGARHSLALKKDGTVWAWGDDSHGGADPNVWGYDRPQSQESYGPHPVQVSGLSHVVAISTSYHHNMAIESDGSLWAWGANECGQLGVPRIWRKDRIVNGIAVMDPSYEAQPVKVPGIADVVAVSAGAFHTIALTHDGKIWTWGAGQLGRLGPGWTSRPPAGSCASLLTRLTAPPEHYYDAATSVVGLGDVVAIGAGATHSMAIRRDGSVIAWGQCEYAEVTDRSSK